MAINVLSATFVERCNKPGRYGDGGGLYLRVRRGKRGLAKNWLLRWKPKSEGARWSKEMFLGPYPTFSLAEARQRARARLQIVYDGGDPAAARRVALAASRIEAAKLVSFKEAAERYLSDNPHNVAWPQTLRDFVFPVIGELPVSGIITAQIADVLRPHWRSKHKTINNVRGRIEVILDWCKAMGLRQGENPARWRGNLDAVFKKDKALTKVTPHAALPYVELPAVLAKLRGIDGFSAIIARALETLALTATRAGETLDMDWAEVDLGKRVWSIPGERTKTGEPLRVPLSTRVVAILTALEPQENGLVFPSPRRGQKMKVETLAKMLKRLSGKDAVTIHGLRSSFRDWCAERASSFPVDAAEMSLGHKVGNRVERSYLRSDLLEIRSQLMQKWCDFCESPFLPSEEKVTLLRRPAS
jgi:integrase